MKINEMEVVARDGPKSRVNFAAPQLAQRLAGIATEPFPNLAQNGARGVRNSSPTSAKPQPRSERQHNEAGQVGK